VKVHRFARFRHWARGKNVRLEVIGIGTISFRQRQRYDEAESPAARTAVRDIRPVAHAAADLGQLRNELP
jgi:hypothetical protein